MKTFVLTGRILFSLIFITSGFSHFTEESMNYAESHGVLMSSVTVPLAGVMCILGGLSIAFGFKAKLGAWLIILFLIPTTILMHNFWTISDPVTRHTQMIMFMKNLSMLGASLLIAYHGAGPASIDHRAKAS